MTTTMIIMIKSVLKKHFADKTMRYQRTLAFKGQDHVVNDTTLIFLFRSYQIDCKITLKLTNITKQILKTLSKLHFFFLITKNAMSRIKAASTYFFLFFLFKQRLSL